MQPWCRSVYCVRSQHSISILCANLSHFSQFIHAGLLPLAANAEEKKKSKDIKCRSVANTKAEMGGTSTAPNRKKYCLFPYYMPLDQKISQKIRAGKPHVSSCDAVCEGIEEVEFKRAFVTTGTATKISGDAKKMETYFSQINVSVKHTCFF